MNSEALQQAVFNKLNVSSITSLLSTAYSPLPAIFTDVPQAVDSGADSWFPFITFGGDTVSPYDTKSAVGASTVLQVDVWSRSRSMLQVKDIADAVDTVIRRQTLSISGETHIGTELGSCTYSLDPDGKTKRAVLLYTVLTLT